MKYRLAALFSPLCSRRKTRTALLILNPQSH
jgi:hypothetical protein